MNSTMDVADAVVIGSGPNGLVAGITLARKGWDVTVLERNATPGGAVASAELTNPGYVHDPFSAFYGLLHSSPVFRELRLDKHVAWAHYDLFATFADMVGAKTPDLDGVSILPVLLSRGPRSQAHLRKLRHRNLRRSARPGRKPLRSPNPSRAIASNR